MHLGLVLDMTSAGLEDRPAIGSGDTSITHSELASRSWAAAAQLGDLGVPSVLYLGGNHLAFPIALFGAAGAGIPLIPLNYRLSNDQVEARLASHPGALVIYDERTLGPSGSGDPRAANTGSFDRQAHRYVERQSYLDALEGIDAAGPPPPPDPDLPCVLLYTSGTTAAPKAAVLRHRHLMAYLLGTVEFASAGADEACLVSVPPYHIAGLANLLTNTYAGRRICYLDQFDPETWLRTVGEQGITQAMVVPTMLARIVSHLEDRTHRLAGTPSLRTLSYGGAPMPSSLLRRAMELFPETGFVNAYGLTETSSTIALLDPEDHRRAFESTDPDIRARLGSVGRVLPGVELDIRDEGGQVLPQGEAGLLYVRGEQISGEYEGERLVDPDGWFATRDRGWVDADGYLFIEGRADDTIIRGGENIAPAEVEDVLVSLRGVADAVVVGLPDEEWGQRLVAVAVPEPGAVLDAEGLRSEIRSRLRSSKTPESIEFWPDLPRTDTGKLLRRQVVGRLTAPSGPR